MAANKYSTRTSTVYSQVNQYDVGPGNNHQLILRVLQTRTWWVDSKKAQRDVQLYWRSRFELSYQLFDGKGKPKLINRFEKYFEMHEKDNVFRNIWFNCQVDFDDQKKRGIKIFDYLPLTFSFRVNEPNFAEDLQSFAKLFIAQARKIDPAKLLPTSNVVDKFDVSHPIYFPFDLTVPARRPIPLSKNRFTNIKPEDVEKTPVYYAGKNIWMLKPSWLSRGRGLELFQSLQELETLLKGYLSGYQARDYSQMRYSDKNEHSPVVDLRKGKVGGNQETASKNKISHFKAATFPVFVIQKYLEKPMLYKSYKFDIRVYACLTQEYELFVFR